MLAEFASVVDALRCALDVQQELANKNAELPKNRKNRFRIGLNLGDVIKEKGRLYGDGVNVAATRCSAASIHFKISMKWLSMRPSVPSNSIPTIQAATMSLVGHCFGPARLTVEPTSGAILWNYLFP